MLRVVEGEGAVAVAVVVGCWVKRAADESTGRDKDDMSLVTRGPQTRSRIASMDASSEFSSALPTCSFGVGSATQVSRMAFPICNLRMHSSLMLINHAKEERY